MPNLQRFGTGESPVTSAKLNLIVDAMTGAGNTPVNHGGVNDPVQYALTVKNQDPAGKAAILYAPNGSTVLLQVTAAGVLASPDGVAAAAPVLTTASSITTAQLAVNAATVVVAAGGAAGSPTTTSATLVDMTDMTVTWTASGGYVVAWLFASVYNQTAGQQVNMAINRGGVDGPQSSFTSTAINAGSTMSILAAYGPLSGSQTIKGRWGVSSGTAVSPGVARTIIVAEFKR